MPVAQPEADIARRITERLVDAALIKNYRITVFDEEDLALPQTTDRTAIMGVLFSTDMEILELHTSAGQRLGSITLLYENGSDVISAYTDNEEIESLCDDVLSELGLG